MMKELYAFCEVHMRNQIAEGIRHMGEDTDSRKKSTSSCGKWRRLLVIGVFSAAMVLSGTTKGYSFTMEDVEKAVAYATTEFCTGEAKPFSTNNMIGFTITQKCFHPGNTLATFGVYMGDWCASTYYFSGGPYQGAGCMGYPIYWAYACGGTGGTVTIGSSTTVWRKCWQSSVTVYCDGNVTQNVGGYVDLSTDCSYITQSPCPWSQQNSMDSCYTTNNVGTIYPICDGSDPCCVDPVCCGVPNCQDNPQCQLEP